MKDQVLRSMATAPRDGTIIIVVDDDFGGLQFMYYGEVNGLGHWYCAAENEPYDLCDGCKFSGWFTVPDDIALRVAAMRLRGLTHFLPEQSRG